MEHRQKQCDQLQSQLSEVKKQLSTKEIEAATFKDQVEKLNGQLTGLETNLAKIKKAKDEADEQMEKLSSEMRETTRLKSESSGAVVDLKKQIERMREAQLDQAEQQRQSFATEKSILVKRYQSLTKDLVEKHEQDLKKMKRRLKDKEATLVQINDELTEVRLKSHELETTLGGASVMKTGRLYFEMGGTPVRDQDLMAELSLLRKKQLDYLEAAT